MITIAWYWSSVFGGGCFLLGLLVGTVNMNAPCTHREGFYQLDEDGKRCYKCDRLMGQKEINFMKGIL